MYCTLADIQDQLDDQVIIELTDDAGAGTIDTAVVDRAVEDADAEVNGYCATRFSVPFSPVPPRIRAISVDIAIYNLFSRRQAVPEERQTRYDNAKAYLANIAKGLVSPGVQPPPDSVGQEDLNGSNQISARTKIFDTATMEKY